MATGARYESDVESVRPIAALSLFYISFLVTEYLFDGRAAAFVLPDEVALVESLAVGMSTAGFLLYALARERRSRAFGPLLHVTGFLSALGTLAVALAPTAPMLYFAGFLTMLLMGFAGAAAHEALARRFAAGPGIARVIGAAYGAAIVVQCIFQAVATSPTMLALLVLVPAVVTPVLADSCLFEDGLALLNPAAAGERHLSVATGDAQSPELRRRTILLIALVALMTCIFSTLNVNLTSAHAAGRIDLGAWTRLFLAASSVAAGDVLDRVEHRWEPALMACVTTLTSFSIFAMLQGASVMLAAVVFYLGSGFFVVFFTSSFMLVARESERYALWSGMGRVVNNVASLVVAAPALALVSLPSAALAETAVVMLILAVMLAVTFLMLLGAGPEPAGPPMSLALGLASLEAASAADRLSAFADEYGLTDREAEVLDVLANGNMNVQDVAPYLGISRTALYRFIENMNAKTGTENRRDLISFYFGWQQDN